MWGFFAASKCNLNRLIISRRSIQNLDCWSNKLDCSQNLYSSRKVIVQGFHILKYRRVLLGPQLRLDIPRINGQKVKFHLLIWSTEIHILHHLWPQITQSLYLQVNSILLWVTENNSLKCRRKTEKRYDSGVQGLTFFSSDEKCSPERCSLSRVIL